MQGRHALSSRLRQISRPGRGGLPPITFQTLHLLMTMPALVNIEITNTMIVAMPLSEIETIFSSLPQLKILYLNHFPLLLHATAFGLELVSAVGHHCKKLQEFGTFFDATRPIPSLTMEDTEGLLPTLTEFCVSVSIINEEVRGDVATYMSHILPRKCESVVVLPEWPEEIETRTVRQSIIACSLQRRNFQLSDLTSSTLQRQPLSHPCTLL